MDAQLSTTLTIALARALESRPTGLIGVSRAAIPGAIEQSTWVAPRVAVAIPRESEVTRSPLADETAGSGSAMNAESFVFGTLQMVAYGRDHAEALVEYSADRDTVL